MTLSKFHTREELETIANYGVDAVSFWQWEATDEWAECFAYRKANQSAPAFMQGVNVGPQIASNCCSLDMLFD